MSDFETLMIRARYALEPENENLQGSLAETLGTVLNCIRHTLKRLSEEERIELIEEIEAFSIHKKEVPLRKRLELLVVNE